MGKESTHSDDIKRYSLFKKLYQTEIPHTKSLAIPKRIHQIWLGPKKPPHYFSQFREKWLQLHPNWEYHLWTESSLKELQLEMQPPWPCCINKGAS